MATSRSDAAYLGNLPVSFEPGLWSILEAAHQQHGYVKKNPNQMPQIRLNSCATEVSTCRWKHTPTVQNSQNR